MLAELKSARETFRFVPAGHYYSPIPSPDAIREHAARLHAAPTAELPGISLNERHQLELLDALKLYYEEFPFPELKTATRRYFFENPAYSYSDAIGLYGMIRHVRPRRIIEVAKAAFGRRPLLRAFLAFNSVYDIVLFNTFLEREERGRSIWLQRRPERE